MTCEPGPEGQTCRYPHAHNGPHSWEDDAFVDEYLSDSRWEAYCAEVVDPTVEGLGLT